MRIAIRVKKMNARVYHAWCPTLPGCSAQGATREDAKLHLKWAIRGYRACLDATVPKNMQEQVLTLSRTLVQPYPFGAPGPS